MNKFDAIDKYRELLDAGFITEEEFKLKVSALLELDDKEKVESIKSNDVVENSVEENIAETEENSDDKFAENNTEKPEENCNHGVSETQNSTNYNETSTDNKTDKKEDFAEIKQKITEKVNFAEIKQKITEKVDFAKVKKKFKKILKTLFKIAVVLLIIFILLIVVMVVTTPDISGFEDTKDTSIHNMKYEIPKTWELDKELSNDVAHCYTLKDDGDIIAVTTVEYVGEEDLVSDDDNLGVKGNLYKEDISYVSEDDYVEEIVVTADNSVFLITLYTYPGDTSGNEDFLEKMQKGFDTEDYKNTRKSLGIKVKYTGKTTEGTVIDVSNDGIKVTETFDVEDIGKITKKLAFGIEKPVKLKAGKTSKVKLAIYGKEKILEIKCTTLNKAQYKAKCVSRNYKNQLRNESYDKHIKIYGKVLQDCGSGYFRISSSGAYDDVYMVYAPLSDIVEEDWCTVYGVTNGTYTYQTVMGASAKIPAIDAKYVER